MKDIVPAPDLTTPYVPRVVEHPEVGYSEWMLEGVPVYWQYADHGRLGPTEIALAVDNDRFVGVRWPLATQLREGSPS